MLNSSLHTLIDKRLTCEISSLVFLSSLKQQLNRSLDYFQTSCRMSTISGRGFKSPDPHRQ